LGEEKRKNKGNAEAQRALRFAEKKEKSSPQS